MAVIWQKKKQNTLYEIRTAGKTRRLYTNGVCHSQYHPERSLTGSIWDLLLLPAFFHKKPVERVLVLGVGGGAVIRLFNDFFQPRQIVGVELDATHIELGRRFFGLQAENIELVEADARDWLADYRGEGFDFVLEDLFSEQKGQPVRAIAATREWCERLSRLLKPGGTLVMNFASENEFRHAAANRAPGISGCRTRFKITHPKLDNIVGVYASRTFSAEQLHDRLSAQPEFAQALQSRYLQYRIRKCRKL